MPKDQRLYMTFPNDFWMHPKIAPLSDAAFRVFVEINGYSRMQDLDGVVPVKLAKAKWKPRAIAELLANHPERPSLSIEGDDYIIWNYAEHQWTKADREKQSQTNAANGALGGRPRKPKETGSVISGKPNVSGSEAKKTQSQSQESESELLTDVTNDSGSSHLPDTTDMGTETRTILGERLKRSGLKDLVAAQSLLASVVDGPVSAMGALLLVEAITSKAKSEVRNVDAYVAQVCRKSPGEVAEAYFDLDIEGVA